MAGNAIVFTHHYPTPSPVLQGLSLKEAAAQCPIPSLEPEGAESHLTGLFHLTWNWGREKHSLGAIQENCDGSKTHRYLRQEITCENIQLRI